MMVFMNEPIHWMGTREACDRLGVTLRTLYRFIDEGQLTAYKMGRVIRLQESDIEGFIGRMKIAPGTLEHLYPEPKAHESRAQGGAGATGTGVEEGGAEAAGMEMDELAVAGEMLASDEGTGQPVPEQADVAETSGIVP